MEDPVRRRQWTYAEFIKEAERVARALLAHFQPGDRIAVWAPNSAEWIILQQGISLAGMVVDLAEALVVIGNRNVISDVAAAAECARAAASTARVNVEINLAAISDERASLEMIAETGKADDIISRAEQITATVREQIRG